MTQSRNTKRAWLASVLSLVLCAAMLIGSTFAWFTDSATTGVNKIVAGNLDVKLEYATAFDDEGNVTAWTEVDEDTQLFSDVETDETTKNLWEPGHTEVVYLKISNVGSLALKYQFAVTVADEVISVNVDGNPLKLSDHLVFGQIEDVQAKYATREAAQAAAGDVKGLSDYTKASSLEAGENSAHYVALVVYMPTTVGNEANHKTGEAVPSIDLGVNLLATQYTSESDSFDNLYDEDALYDNEKLATTDEEVNNLLNDIASGNLNNVNSVYLANGEYALANTVSLAQGLTLAGAGANKTTVTVPAVQSGQRTTGLVVEESGVTVKDVTLVKNSALSSDQYAGVVAIKKGNTTLENVAVETDGYTTGVLVDSFKDDVVTISNSIITAGWKAVHIADGANGKVVIDNTEITGVYTFNVNSSSSKDLVIEVRDSKLHGWTSYSEVKLVSFSNTEFSKGGSSYNFIRPYADTTFTNCTFDEEFTMGAGAAVSMTFTNCYFGDTKLTAENLHTMFDSTELATLKQCTITVDGVTVTNSGE